MIPEQVWDADDVPKHSLFNGKPSGSGMPLAWVHAEYIKLLRSVRDGNVWDTPPQPVKRYQIEERSAGFQIWTEREPRKWITAGKQLRMDFCEPAEVRWALDDGVTSSSTATESVAEHLHSVLLPLPQDRPWKILRLTVRQKGSIRRLRIESRESSSVSKRFH